MMVASSWREGDIGSFFSVDGVSVLQDKKSSDLVHNNVNILNNMIGNSSIGNYMVP